MRGYIVVFRFIFCWMGFDIVMDDIVLGLFRVEVVREGDLLSFDIGELLVIKVEWLDVFIEIYDFYYRKFVLKYYFFKMI